MWGGIVRFSSVQSKKISRNTTGPPDGRFHCLSPSLFLRRRVCEQQSLLWLKLFIAFGQRSQQFKIIDLQPPRPVPLYHLLAL